MSMKKQKNSDIQLLRALAITAVLGFHLKPKFVPQGYLGVDIFFAISGYLMTMILDGKTLSLTTCLIFYERRLKRLLPAYLLAILLTLATGSLFLISTDYEFLKFDAIWAIFFATNLQSLFEKESYFKLVGEYKFLLHAWSLSVEFQYYLFAPFILIFIQKCSSNPVKATFFIGLGSFLFQTFIPIPIISFGMVLSRLWQFLIGTIVYYYHKRKYQKLSYSHNFDESSENLNISTPSKQKLNYRILNFVVLCVICFMPDITSNFLHIAFMRLFATGLGGLAIYYGLQEQTTSSKWVMTEIFENVCVYYGNISYSVYLIHWPIIIFAKYIEIFDIIPLWQLLVIIFAISMLQYHFFEKPLLTQSGSRLVFIILIILGLILMLLLKPQRIGNENENQSFAISENLKIAKECSLTTMKNDCNWDSEMLKVIKKSTKGDAFFCSYKGTGNATIFFTGNSFALRQISAIKKALKDKYKILYVAARPSCVAFEKFNGEYKDKMFKCNEIFNSTAKFLAKLKPDILLISQRIEKNNWFRKPIENFEMALNDSATSVMVEYFKLWSAYTKHIVIIEPHPTFEFNPATSIAKQLTQKKPLNNAFLTREEILTELNTSWIRIKAAISLCPKCSALEINEAFMENHKYNYYDKNSSLSLFCDGIHLSPKGTDKMVPILRESISKLLDG